ncbi:hypothetical protein Scep_013995 [Stephania cephalantha]|uniref:Beta-1,3-glucanase n=1 Tax=Stephania cephalantha TaxID=152367 RepID=A0AAP0J0G5_9MAGN
MATILVCNKASSLMAVTALLLGLLLASLEATGAQSIGVCYGRNGNNLPSPPEVVALYRQRNIGRMRIYDPAQDVLQALRGSNIELILGVPNPDLQRLASDQGAANNWVQTNVRNFPDVRFKYIAVAMRNINNALGGLRGQIKVTTAIDTGVVTNAFPPSNGVFRNDAGQYMRDIVGFLAANGAPILVNVYPYFGYIYNKAQIKLGYAQFTLPNPEVIDTNNNLRYQNLFDALVDAFYAALGRAGGSSVEIVVSESGWPSAGGDTTSIDLARTYNQNLINHVRRGTPLKPRPIEAYIFAMFNENNKSPEFEKNFGLFYPRVQSIGVCYGQLGNNLPSKQEVVDLYKSKGIGSMRIYFPEPETLQALGGSNIELIMDVPVDKLESIASDANAANDWVQNNIKNYPDVKFKYIAVGNEVSPVNGKAQYASFVLPAMQNINRAIADAGLQIKVTTSLETGVLDVPSYPPSRGSFQAGVQQFLSPIINFLVNNGSPLLVNVYPYLSINDPNIKLEYALFTLPSAEFSDGQLSYQNLFDATLDAMYSALEKAGGAALEIVVSESGWPSDGGNAATIDNARTYNQNLIQHVRNGTPKRPGRPIETYIFAMFNENKKNGDETERHFGLFYPNKDPVYQINF